MHCRHKMSLALAAALAAMALSPTVHAAQHHKSASAHHANQGLEDDGNDSGSSSSSDSGDDNCDPFSDWDWHDTESGSDDSTAGQLRAGSRGPSSARMASTRMAAGAAVAQVIGTTPEAIERNFMRVVTRNLSNAGTASRIARLSDRELEAIARHAGHGAPAEQAAMLKLFATRLDGAGLVRVARAFGRAPVEAAVHAYADPATRGAFATRVAGLGPSLGSGNGSYPRPTLDMTLEEIYLEFRTAPMGSLSPAAALAETSMYAGSWLFVSYQGGEAIGNEIHMLIETYDPSLDETLGDIIGSMIDNLRLAGGELQQGHFDAAFDDLFGFPLTWGSDPWGDWDIGKPMVDYYKSTDSCGY